MGVALITAYVVNYSPIGTYLDSKFRDTIKTKQRGKKDPEVCQVQAHLKTPVHNAFDFVDTRVIGPTLLTLLALTVPLSIMRMTPAMDNAAVINYDTFISNM
jgi:hypothetical protein